VVGCGSIGRTHLAAYRANGVVAAAVADADPKAVRRAVEEFGGKEFGSAEELIASGLVDAISVCTPPATHREIVEMALMARIAVLCEKPMATTVEDAEAMFAAAERDGVLLAVGFCHRFQPQIERMRDLLLNGELGTVLMFRNRFGGHLQNAEQRWFSDAAVAGGGALSLDRSLPISRWRA
jgi:predicted dehydrogenase